MSTRFLFLLILEGTYICLLTHGDVALPSKNVYVLANAQISIQHTLYIDDQCNARPWGYYNK